MATLDTASDTASPPRAPVVRRSALGCTKVRDSCQSCATSKIKCPKEKTSCSKCQARGIECQYFFARRPGRRRENSTGHPTSCTSTSTTANSSSSSSRSSNSSSSSSTSPPSSSSSLSSNPEPTSDKDLPRPRSGDGAAANSTEPSILPPANNSVLDITPTDNVLGPYSSDLFSVLEDPSVFAPLPDFDSNMTDVDFSTMDYFEQPVMDGDNFTRALSDIGSLLIPETISFDLGALESDPLSASAVPSLASSVPTPSTAHSVTMMRGLSASISCRCVSQALDLLKALSAKSAPVSPFSGPGAASMTTMSSVQALMGENQQYIDNVSNLLSCSSCTEDTFLLAIVSMIVLKILERYASAARAQVGGGESDTGQRPATSMIPNGKDQMRPLGRIYSTGGRDSARSVLSELHRVQKLVNLLSPKLKKRQEADTRAFAHVAWGRHTVSNENDKALSTLLSPDTLAQMEGDMRKSLSSLSANIINRLRQD
uniref:Notoamide biosynthesis transcriptional activator notL n=1 Tax=Aspergillus sp. (strain MF297-2) TaxID=877550 RepID=NOTL_ASPSM|nr:RecName: Full=Notoamide biosynthesis transcriptional activator notL; AltName: Full=Notoamide biosynthesis cluster protein L [Aspergillus sp. MF297-2]ADM34145.1 trancriptional activator [Aspergillus sp. MF297-2]